MVLDAKAMTWAAANSIDTAKLKAAKVPIYGKWYFPELPADTPLVNLETGERVKFAVPMVAGETLWVSQRDLQRADFIPVGDEIQNSHGSERALAEEMDVEPVIAMARPAGAMPLQLKHPVAARTPSATAFPPIDTTEFEVLPPEGIHLPLASIAPLILAVGITLAVIGVVTNPIWLVVGLIWSAVGALGWIRIGLLEARSATRADAHHD